MPSKPSFLGAGLGEDGCARAPSSGGEGVAGASADSSKMLMISPQCETSWANRNLKKISTL